MRRLFRISRGAGYRGSVDAADWIRDRLRPSRESWSSELVELRRELASKPRSARKIERTLELARASEYIDPDRGRAFALYLDAWRAGHPDAGAPLLAMARELRAYVTIAELALAEHETSQDPASLIAAGRAFVDAGFSERAVEPLTRALEKRSFTAQQIASMTDIKVVLAAARGHRYDAENEIESMLGRAREAGLDAGGFYIHAARIAQVAGLAARRSAVVTMAAWKAPHDREVALLAEDVLLERGNADELLEYYSRRFDAAKGAIEWTSVVRSAGCELLLRNIHPGLGLRLLRSSLERAYAALIPEVPRHIAAWELLLAQASNSQSTIELVPLIDSALNAPLGGDEVLFLSRTGLEIVWRDARDTTAAQPFAAAVLDICPTHPLALELVAEVVPALADAAPATIRPPVIAPATTRIPTIEAVARRTTTRTPSLAQPRSAATIPPAACMPRTPIAKALTAPLPVFEPPDGVTSSVAATPGARSTSPTLANPPRVSTCDNPRPPPRDHALTMRLPVFEPPDEPTSPVVATTTATMTTGLPVFEPSPVAEATARVRPPTPGGALNRDASRIPVTTRTPIDAIDRAARKVIAIDVMIELPTGGFFSTVVRDLSTSGAFVLTKRSVELGIELGLELRLPAPKSLKQITMRVSVRVSRWTALGWGVAFVDATPELIAAIRRLG